MRPYRGIIWASALVLWGISASPVEAAWCNVFQVCWHKNRSSCYQPCDPCPQPCPPVCTTRYVQRCYYQPVTSYVSRSYYEQVTTYRTSYYYEPVTSYRYSCYYDPCTCSYQQVACPTTSYQLRSQCCPVTSWVQRCCSVPVTSYQQSYYWEPVTSCCTPTSAVAAAPAPCPEGTAAPQQPGYQTQPPPGVSEQRMSPGVMSPGVMENRGGTSAPPMSGTPIRPLMVPQQPQSPRMAPPPGYNPPKVRLDGIVSLPGQLDSRYVRNGR